MKFTGSHFKRGGHGSRKYGVLLGIFRSSHIQRNNCLVGAALFIFLNGTVWAEQVCRVKDGDTLLMCDQRTIRLPGIDAPEKKQAFGPEAKAYLTRLVSSRDVQLTCFGRDIHKRDLCWASVSLSSGVQLDLGREMVGMGLAFHYREFTQPSDFPAAWRPQGAKYRKRLVEAEKFAQQQQRGIWGIFPDGGVRPWEYRKGGGR